MSKREIKIVYNPVLCLIREKVMRENCKLYPEVKKFFKLASKKQIKQWEKEVRELDV